MRNVLDLFSCIGGHTLGLHATGGFRTVAFVESHPWRRLVLSRHFPDVPLHDDVRTFHPSLVSGPIDIIMGGPPCQRTSVGAAIHGYRSGESLWPEMLRIVHEARETVHWIVIEQPPGNREWEDQVARDLEGTGYRSSRLVLSACGTGAPHLRRRVFILANRCLSRLSIARETIASTTERIKGGIVAGNPWGAGPPRALRVADGVPGGVDRRCRIESIGDSNPPIFMTLIGLGILAADRYRSFSVRS